MERDIRYEDEDPYRGVAGSPYLQSSVRIRQQAKPVGVPWHKRAFPLLSVLMLGAVIAIIVVAVQSRGDDSSTGSDTTTNNNNASDNSSSSSENTTTTTTGSTSGCPSVSPANRTVVFWQSEVSGCEQIPTGVTHVVFGFALVADGEIVPTFQSSDAYIQKCVQQLRANCIASLGSIGGSTNNKNLSEVSDAEKFAASAVALVKKFGFDGLDFDDEAVGSEFNATQVVNLVSALRSALDGVNPDLLLTYDAYFREADDDYCTNPDLLTYTRCFPSNVLTYVDWVNIMAYNVNDNATEAAEFYANALTTTFVNWYSHLGNDFSLATIGVCLGSSCAYGPGPSDEVIASWTEFSRKTGSGGMMIYAASSEVNDDFPVTRSIVATN